MQSYFNKNSAPSQVLFREYYHTFQKSYFLEDLQTTATVSHRLTVLHNILKTSCMSLLTFLGELESGFTFTAGVLNMYLYNIFSP